MTTTFIRVWYVQLKFEFFHLHLFCHLFSDFYLVILKPDVSAEAFQNDFPSLPPQSLKEALTLIY